MNGIYIDIDKDTATKIAEQIITDDLRSNGYYIKKTPRIEIVPPYSSDIDITLPENLTPYPIEVTSIRLEPDIETPKKIVLDVSDDMTLQLWRDEIMNQIPKDEIFQDPNPIYITLVEHSSDENVTIEPDQHNDLIKTVRDYDISGHIIGTDIRIDTPDIDINNQ